MLATMPLHSAINSHTTTVHLRTIRRKLFARSVSFARIQDSVPNAPTCEDLLLRLAIGGIATVATTKANRTNSAKLLVLRQG